MPGVHALAGRRPAGPAGRAALHMWHHGRAVHSSSVARRIADSGATHRCPSLGKRPPSSVQRPARCLEPPGQRQRGMPGPPHRPRGSWHRARLRSRPWRRRRPGAPPAETPCLLTGPGTAHPPRPARAAAFQASKCWGVSGGSSAACAHGGRRWWQQCAARGAASSLQRASCAQDPVWSAPGCSHRLVSQWRRHLVQGGGGRVWHEPGGKAFSNGATSEGPASHAAGGDLSRPSRWVPSLPAAAHHQSCNQPRIPPPPPPPNQPSNPSGSCTETCLLTPPSACTAEGPIPRHYTLTPERGRRAADVAAV